MAVNPAPVEGYNPSFREGSWGREISPNWCWVNPVRGLVGKQRRGQPPQAAWSPASLPPIGDKTERKRAGLKRSARTTLVFASATPEATRALGAALGRLLPGGTVLALQGPLGSGKTTFAQGLARGLGVRGPVASPTFILCAVHPLPKRRWFCHADLYRVRQPSAVPWEPLRDYLGAKDAITAIEWPEKITQQLPRGTVRIIFRHAKKGRSLTIQARRAFLAKLQSVVRRTSYASTSS